MKHIIASILICIAFSSSFSQSNNDEYNRLLKSAKKPNIPHFKFNIGIGVGKMGNFVQKENSIHYFTPRYRLVDSSFESATFPLLAAYLDMDIVETKHVYFNMGGAYTFGFWPSGGKSNVEGVEESKGREKLNHYDVHFKLGYGGEAFKVYEPFKIYVIGGLESYNFIHTYHFKTTIRGTASESWDTGYVKQNYPKVGLGIRIGNNRQKFNFDLNVYKLLPENRFFVRTQKPSVGKMLGSFGKYETFYPSLPLGFSMSLQRNGKYEVKVHYRKIRERDSFAKNTHSFMLDLSKQFDFYNKKKK